MNYSAPRKSASSKRTERKEEASVRASTNQVANAISYFRRKKPSATLTDLSDAIKEKGSQWEPFSFMKN
jgi:hypothetical protein